jgi:hypothetical protein
MPTGWQIGISIAVAVMTIFFVVTLALDIHYHLVRRPSVADRVQRWSFRYPYWSLALIALYGAMMAHFFINTGTGTSQ